ncbi:hypothetical protein TNCV_1038851 [Trichonephila clavipes]|uniref:Uncharacterized protein n=1 Tax=Trichonephila clavipes TaxID=2585209 RepID=A0A8X6VWA8_TRICX|nr:hypothetical protein TNCV_1038851 [Trichonephila clavipes]
MRPSIAYACPVCRYAANTNIKILDTLQNSLICTIVKATRYMPNDDIQITELYLIQHIVNRIEPQVQAYVEVRNHTTRAQLLQDISQFEGMYLSRETQGSSTNYNRNRQDFYVHRMSTDNRRNRNRWNAEVLEQQNDKRDNYRSTYGRKWIPQEPWNREQESVRQG